MSSLSQLQAGQQEIDTVKTEIQQTKQDLPVAEQAGDGAKVAFLRKRLEQLGEKELILLRAQAPGQLCLLLSPHASLHTTTKLLHLPQLGQVRLLLL